MKKDTIITALLLLINFLVWSIVVFALGLVFLTSRVDAKVIREGNVFNASNSKLYTATNSTRIIWTGNWSYMTLYYDITGSSGQNILFSTNYSIVTHGSNVGRISVGIWYIGTDGSWNQIIDYCTRSGSRTDSSSGSSWDYNIVCSIPTTKNFSEISVQISMVDSNGNNVNTPYLSFLQKNNSISVSGTSNESIGDEIMNNDDKNTNNIMNNDDKNTEKITDSIDDINTTLTDDSVDDQSSFFSNFDGGSYGNLSDIISLPLDFVSSLNGTCSSIDMPRLNFHGFNLDVSIPCMSSFVYNKFPSGIIDTLKLIINGFLLYRMLSWFIDFIQKLKNPNDDEIEVLEL